MIYDTLDRFPLYADIIPHGREIAEYLKTADLLALEPGIHEILGQDVFVNRSSLKTQPVEERSWEGHAQYADLQIELTGVEDYGTMPAMEGLTVTSQKGDTWKYADPGCPFGTVSVRAGEFAFFAPGELHRPGCAHGEPGEVEKAIIKIRY